MAREAIDNVLMKIPKTYTLLAEDVAVVAQLNEPFLNKLGLTKDDILNFPLTSLIEFFKPIERRMHFFQLLRELPEILIRHGYLKRYPMDTVMFFENFPDNYRIPLLAYIDFSGDLPVINPEARDIISLEISQELENAERQLRQHIANRTVAEITMRADREDKTLSFDIKVRAALLFHRMKSILSPYLRFEDKVVQNDGTEETYKQILDLLQSMMGVEKEGDNWKNDIYDIDQIKEALEEATYTPEEN